MGFCISLTGKQTKHQYSVLGLEKKIQKTKKKGGPGPVFSEKSLGGLGTGVVWEGGRGAGGRKAAPVGQIGGGGNRIK